MHPLVLWSIAAHDLAEREQQSALERAQRDSGIAQPRPLTRDERWMAAIHRWAAAEPVAPVLPAEPAPTAAPRLGCA